MGWVFWGWWAVRAQTGWAGDARCLQPHDTCTRWVHAEPVRLQCPARSTSDADRRGTCLTCFRLHNHGTMLSIQNGTRAALSSTTMAYHHEATALLACVSWRDGPGWKSACHQCGETSEAGGSYKLHLAIKTSKLNLHA